MLDDNRRKMPKFELGANKFPFKVFLVTSHSVDAKTRLPMEQFNCGDCGKPCGHQSHVAKYETRQVQETRIYDYEVSGIGDQEYFVRSDDEESDGVYSISFEGTFLDLEEAEAEKERLDVFFRDHY